MPYLNETDYQELTEARYQDEQTIADLEAELKTKKRDTEHLLELGKQISALKSERYRLREALRNIRAEAAKPADGFDGNDDPMTLLMSIDEIAKNALDKDAR